MRRLILCVIQFAIVSGLTSNWTDRAGALDQEVDKEVQLILKNLENQKNLFVTAQEPNPSHYSIFSFFNRQKEETSEFTNHKFKQDIEIGGTNIGILQRNLEDVFVKPRFTEEAREKAGNVIFERLAQYTLETRKMRFTARSPEGITLDGCNIMGVIPGRNRNQPGSGIIVIGAHYDTVRSSPGVDDNGSGVVALLEAARLLSPRMGQWNNSIILVAFDLHERGILGSLSFVNEYLIPTELVEKKGKFIGAYILDMVLNFDATPRSQILPYDISFAVPEAANFLRRNNYQGDFISVWSRRVVDWHLWYSFQNAWHKDAAPPYNKILVIDPPIPRQPLLFTTWRYRIFLKGDHSSFWSHKNGDHRDSLNAVLITDMGAWRGSQRACYHEFCDDKRQVTIENLGLLQHVVDALAAAVASLAE